jgi:hypothetical protein
MEARSNFAKVNRLINKVEDALVSDMPKFPNLNLSATPGLYWTDCNVRMPQLQQLDSPALSSPRR